MEAPGRQDTLIDVPFGAETLATYHPVPTARDQLIVPWPEALPTLLPDDVRIVSRRGTVLDEAVTRT
jgi:hypothetical protein